MSGGRTLSGANLGPRWEPASSPKASRPLFAPVSLNWVLGSAFAFGGQGVAPSGRGPPRHHRRFPRSSSLAGVLGCFLRCPRALREYPRTTACPIQEKRNSAL